MAIPKFYGFPQDLADALTSEVEKVVSWFHSPSSLDYPAAVTKRPIYDDEVEERILGFQVTMDREIARICDFKYYTSAVDGDWSGWQWRYDPDWRERHAEWVRLFSEWSSTEEGREVLDRENCHRYDLMRLPYDLRRALVTRWEKIWEGHAEGLNFVRRLGEGETT